MKKILKTGLRFKMVDGDGIQVLDNLPPSIYRVEEDRSGPYLINTGQEKFIFPTKIYDLENINAYIKYYLKTWNSDIYKKSNKNLGIIFNGLKGTGKTIAAKLLCNEANVPIILVNRQIEDSTLVNFLSSIPTRCIVFIDEFEKIFSPSESIGMLTLLDGVENDSSKLFLLNTNSLSINENMLSRPGRVRYIKQFKGLSKASVNEYLSDVLPNNPDVREKMIEFLNSLEFLTMDILKNMVDEYMIHGELCSLFKETVNVRLAVKSFQTIRIDYVGNFNDESYLNKIVDLLNYLKSVYLFGSWKQPSEGQAAMMNKHKDPWCDDKKAEEYECSADCMSQVGAKNVPLYTEGKRGSELREHDKVFTRSNQVYSFSQDENYACRAIRRLIGNVLFTVTPEDMRREEDVEISAYCRLIDDK